MPQLDPDRANRCPKRFGLPDDDCIGAKCRWWIDYGQDDGGCAVTWMGECIEYHVQRFCNELSGIKGEIAELRRQLESDARAARKAAARKEER